MIKSVVMTNYFGQNGMKLWRMDIPLRVAIGRYQVSQFVGRKPFTYSMWWFPHIKLKGTWIGGMRLRTRAFPEQTPR